MKSTRRISGPLVAVCSVLVWLGLPARIDGQPATLVHDRFVSGDFKLVAGAQVASLVISADDHKVVQIAAKNLSEDIERVTGKKPPVVNSGARIGPYAVIIGTLGKSPFIDSLVQRGKLGVGDLRGQW